MSSGNSSFLSVGVCPSTATAVEIVRRLRERGFSNGEISVIGSHEELRRSFSQSALEVSDEQAAMDASGRAAVGLGAAAVIAGFLTTAGAAVAVLGAFSGLAIAGSLASLWTHHGAGDDFAEACEDDIRHGKTLVVVAVRESPRRDQAVGIMENLAEVTRTIPATNEGDSDPVIS